MRAVVIYESMFGNTRRIAESIVEGLASTLQVRLIRANRVLASDLEGVDLVVVGAPTHGWSLPRGTTRQNALATARRSDNDLVLEPGADSSPGVREWLQTLGSLGVPGAVFDTRLHAPQFLTGHATKAISKGLRQRGADLVLAPESFFVDRRNHMVAGERERAREWGGRLGVELMRRARPEATA